MTDTQPADSIPSTDRTTRKHDPMSDFKELKNSLTLTEIGVIVSLLTSLGMGIFTLGVVYGQVQQNTAEISAIKPKMEGVEKRVERIDANVAFLTELAREDRLRQ